MAMATGVTPEPTIRSTLSSLMKRRAFCTPFVGSVASSRMTSRIFSPPTVAGHIFTPWLMGMPRPEPGPVSGRLTPIVMSASAAPEASSVTAAAAAAARVVLRKRVMVCLLTVV